ncbi:MAG: hydrogenase iron-sulfur subunit [Pseudomonadota bacterium]
MKNNEAQNARIGVFLCQCGRKIDGTIDLGTLENILKDNPQITYVDTLPFSCQAPGLKAMKKAAANLNLNRVIVAGCETRIMLKKFEKELLELGLEEGQIEVVNLRDHVALANAGSPEALAAKGAKLIAAAAASLAVLIPSTKEKVSLDKPVMIVGGGIATYSAAQVLLRKGVESIIAINTDDPDDEIRMLHETYPGERDYHEKLRRLMSEVFQSPLVKKITVGELVKVLGKTGNLTVTFAGEKNKPPLVFECGTLIAALDGQMLNQGSDFGHDGVKVVCQTEMEEYLWLHGAPTGKVVFWVNDPETPGRPWSHLAARTAWNLALYIKDSSQRTDVSILYNSSTEVPLTAMERARARQLDIKWIPYHPSYRPTVQCGYVTYTRTEDQIEAEIPWDMLCLSPLRSTGKEALETARILGFDVEEGRFLERNPQMVRPEHVGQDEKLIAGSARRPCDLQEALRQGRRAADSVAEMYKKAEDGQLYAPRMVCVVDQSKCVGCGLCNEICDCHGFEPFEGKGGNIPRTVDPMVCTGGGTCAASCPYQALNIQNNTTAMREARVSALVHRLEAGEIMGFGCNWGGGAAADNAGLKGLKYDSRFHLLQVPCIGQLDPAVLGRAFVDGANGLLLLGCPPEECHHSYGLDHSWSRVNLIKKLLTVGGLDRNRIALAHVDINNSEGFVKAVNNFMAEIERLGPIERTPDVQARLVALYDTLNDPRVRWVLGAGLRRPQEKHYPADQRNALAYDQTFLDVVTEEFLRRRVINLLKRSGETMELKEIAVKLSEEPRLVSRCLSDLAGEGAVSRIFKDRTPFYVLH